jgi:CO/xanthine dehydrogenase FAD-binding subunit
MSVMKYLRPESLQEALVALDEARPLAGGTDLTPQRRTIEAVLDLQDLGLDGLDVSEKAIRAGSMVRLQAFLSPELELPDALREVCRLEAGWNLRNMITVGGALRSGDGRSPLLVVAAALGCEVLLQPGDRSLTLDAFFEVRESSDFRSLITAADFPQPLGLAYEQVARSPADRPLVCVAGARLETHHGQQELRIALGGFGPHPLGLQAREISSLADVDAEDLERAASAAYEQADDAWASSRYRAHIAGILIGRVLAEVAR